MDADTLTALQASIAHWEENSLAESPVQELTSADACALCELFMDNDCSGCPVR